MAPLPPNAELPLLARALLAGRGDPALALPIVEAQAPGSRAALVLREAVAGNVASELPAYNAAVGAYIESLRSASLFARMLADGALTRVPLQTAVVAVTSLLTGSSPDEVTAKPISRLALSASDLTRAKSVVITVMSEELYRASTPAAQALFTSELRGAVSTALDAGMLTIAMAGAPSFTPTTMAPADLLDAMRRALDVVNTTGAGRLYWAVEPKVANGLATAASDGVLAFEGMTPTGGTLLGQPAMVSSAVPLGRLELLNATDLAGEIDTIELSVAAHATVLMDSMPADGPAALTSLWATNSRGLKCEAFYGLKRLRDTASASITELDFGGST
jgi:hypothetical protein